MFDKEKTRKKKALLTVAPEIAKRKRNKCRRLAASIGMSNSNRKDRHYAVSFWRPYRQSRKVGHLFSCPFAEFVCQTCFDSVLPVENSSEILMTYMKKSRQNLSDGSQRLYSFY